MRRIEGTGPKQPGFTNFERLRQPKTALGRKQMFENVEP
jgi:hypothetical protein